MRGVYSLLGSLVLLLVCSGLAEAKNPIRQAFFNTYSVVSSFLSPITPNPFASRASFSFAIAQPGRVDLAVFDVRGRRVRVLEDELRPAGRYTMHWDGRDDRGSELAAGVYFVRLRSGHFHATERTVLVR